MHVFIVTFDQFAAFLLNKSFYFFVYIMYIDLYKKQM